MRLQNKYLKYSFVILVAACAVLFIQRYVSEPSITTLKTQTEETQKEESKASKDADYIASPPTFGPLIQTQSIDVTFQNDQAIGLLDGKAANEVAPKQDVILFDKEGYVLPLGGSVENIEENKNNQKKITITLPEGTHTALLSNKLDIITLETIASKRLPIEALLQDENRRDFVWVLNTDSKKPNKVHRLYIDVGLSDNRYFEEAGHKIESFTPVIINPDNKIKSDKKYNIVVTEIDGPLHNPIRQAWVNYEVSRLETQQQTLQKIADECSQGKKALILQPGATTLADGTQTGNACGQASNAPLAPLQIFNSLINKNNNGAAGCGGVSSACGQ